MENNWIASHVKKQNLFLTTGEVCLKPITEGIQRTAACYLINIAFKGSPDKGGPFCFVRLQDFQIEVVFLE